ncbi:hypothetical protein [Helicobacter brantae]|uniref:Uncharacterized protein n=1 Tax=Helicobacter brantae TaxID=375927 RepID=A0A3D8IZW7_9HELI|nr:hypothetical protein [Helicobacter brantae]RDU70788.1 hypothetical protein CQA58_04485 [Helicobacter brantae]
MNDDFQSKILHFCSNPQNLISLSRFNSYKNTQEHQSNLHLISHITPKLAILELSLRNVIDFALKLTLGNEWLQTLKQQYMQKDKSKTPFEERLLLEISKIENKYTKRSNPLPKQDQYISNLSLGFWVKIADEFKICSLLFNPSLLDFRNYGGSYNNRDISKAQKHWNIIYAMNCF